MASWIEFHATRIKRLEKFWGFRKVLGWSDNEALGFLGTFWCEVLDLKEDGDLADWTVEYFAELFRFEASRGKIVWDALVSNRWVDDRSGKVLVHDWLDFAGKYLTSKYKKRRDILVAIWEKHGRIYGEKQEDEGEAEGKGKGSKGEVKGNSTLPNHTLDKSKDLSSSSPPYLLAEFFVSQIRRRDEKFRQPNMDAWAKVFDDIMRIDRRTFEEIKNLIAWCQQDSFWSSNILSPKKLREKFSALLIKKNEGEKSGGTANNRGGYPNRAAQRAQSFREHDAAIASFENHGRPDRADFEVLDGVVSSNSEFGNPIGRGVNANG